MARLSLLPALLVTVAVAVVPACDRRKGPGDNMKPAESWNEGDEPQGGGGGGGGGGNPHGAGGGGGGVDPHAGMDMGGGGGGVDPHAGMDMGGGAADPHAGMDMGGGSTGPGGLPAPDPDRAIDPSKFLKGTIQLGAGATLPADGVLFLAVRPADAAGNPAGPPIAVERLTGLTLPAPFALTEEQAMIGGTSFAGPVVITARFDQDSDVDSKQPGDLSGKLAATIPSEGLVLTLDTVLP